MSELIFYEHPIIGHTFRVNEEDVPVIDVLERAGRWVSREDIHRWSGVLLVPGCELETSGLVERQEVETSMLYRLWGLPEKAAQRPTRRRMMFAVGHPSDFREADFSVLSDKVGSIWWGLDHLGSGEIPDWVPDWVEGDPPVLVAGQDTRALDAAKFDDWRDLQERIVLVRPGGELVTLTDLEAQELMRDLPLQPVSKLIYERGLIYDPADRAKFRPVACINGSPATVPDALAHAARTQSPSLLESLLASPAEKPAELPAGYSIFSWPDAGRLGLWRGDETSGYRGVAHSNGSTVTVFVDALAEVDVPLSALRALAHAARTQSPSLLASPAEAPPATDDSAELFERLFIEHNACAGFPLDTMKGRVYRHWTTQTHYHVVDVVVREHVVDVVVREHDLAPLVVYKRVGFTIPWCRPLNEFVERFVLVDSRRKSP